MHRGSGSPGALSAPSEAAFKLFLSGATRYNEAKLPQKELGSKKRGQTVHRAPVCRSLAGVSALGFLLRPKPMGTEQPRASAAPHGASLDVQRQPRRQQREATRCFRRVKFMAKPRNLVLSLSNVQSCKRFVCSGQKLGLKHWKCSGRR